MILIYQYVYLFNFFLKIHINIINIRQISFFNTYMKKYYRRQQYIKSYYYLDHYFCNQDENNKQKFKMYVKSKDDYNKYEFFLSTINNINHKKTKNIIVMLKIIISIIHNILFENFEINV